MKVYLASDHAGFDLKEQVKTRLTELGYKVKDFGAFSFNPEDDYPDFVSKAAEKVSRNNGIAFIFGGSGQGEAIVANRFKNVRAVVIACENIDLVRLAREHNNANVLSFGARFVSYEFTLKAVESFLSLKFKGEERHTRRILKIDKYADG